MAFDNILQAFSVIEIDSPPSAIVRTFNETRLRLRSMKPMNTGALER